MLYPARWKRITVDQSKVLKNLLFRFLGATRYLVKRPQFLEWIETSYSFFSLFQVFRLVSICLGLPPATFTWEYHDKQKEYKKIGPISPKDFYHTHVKPVFNLDDKVG